MRLRLRYFASLKENLGTPGETIDLPAGIESVAALRDWLSAHGREAIAATRNLRCAVNQEMVKLDTAILDGDEIAFFPPVTGG